MPTSIPPRPHPLRGIFSSGATAFLFVQLLMAECAAQNPGATGVVQGAVSNIATGAYLNGAQVTLSPGDVTVLTSRDGRFVFSNVVAGEHRLTISYSGLDRKTVAGRVAAGGTAEYDVGLTSGVYQLEKFVVAGEREGNALAITQQRNADNVKTVIAADAFGNVADLNLGNFLMRLPGVGKEESEGEIIRVQIRGVNSNLSAVSLDGTRAANGSTRSFERGFEIDKIPTDFIETIEITKAMTPDVDADSIGGAVNLKTKSALDRKGRRTTFQTGGSYNVLRRTADPSGSFNFSDVFKGKLGVLFTASYNHLRKPRQAARMDFERTTDTSRPMWFNFVQFGEDGLKHERAGLGLRFDYQLTPATRLYFNTTYSYYYDQLNRHWGVLSTPSSTTGIVSVSNEITETRNHNFTRNQFFRDRDIITWNYTFGGESRFWGGKLDYNANFSPSTGTDVSMDLNRVTAGVGFRQDRTKLTPGSAELTQISGPDLADWRFATLNATNFPRIKSQDSIKGAQVNFAKPFTSPVPWLLKTGLRVRAQTREKDESRRVYNYIGPNGVVGPAGLTNDDNLDRFQECYSGYSFKSYPSLYRQIQWIDLNQFKQAIVATPNLFREDIATGTRDTIRNDLRAAETVTAAYAMGSVRFGPLGIVTGVRVEDTRLSAQGYRQVITPAEKARRAAWVGTVTDEETIRRTLAEYANRTEGKGNYRDYFPSIHFKYRLTQQLQARASFSTGIGRPNFGQIVPNNTVDNELLTITGNNPDLKAQHAKNYDVTLEYYFEPAGSITVGAFSKKISDFIFRGTAGRLERGNAFGDEYTGYELFTDFNGGFAKVRGVEFSYSQQFSNLPGFWRGFGAYANYTYLKSEGNYGLFGVAKAELANFTPRAGNIGISYIAHGWSVRVKMSHTGRRLAVFSASNLASRTYNYPTSPVDFNISYAFSRRLSVYADVINVFNVQTNNQYMYIPDRYNRADTYSTIMKFGVSGNF